MNKKHLTTCLMLLVLISSAKLFTDSSKPASLQTDNYRLQDSFNEINTRPSPQVHEKAIKFTYSFANEMLPTGPAIISRMRKALKNYSFENMQTIHLHANADKWFPVIVPILRAHGIPEDFKYIPLVESGFEAGSSSKGASGYWQFMPETARGFGLKVNENIDERHNVHKSTIAACKYIKSLYREFGSWTLAAAAYNIGGNSLKRHMADQKEENYYKMKLNRETSAYLFQLMSMKEIIEKPRLHGYYHTKKNRVLRAEVSQTQLPAPLMAQNYHAVFPSWN